mmetsp:Transcript_84978/g.241021  ORF Transcript_84978/g.241021 Transcript_84978/m.241021 type:complete len:219 (+) Transcript_84978:693-1349(+)
MHSGFLLSASLQSLIASLRAPSFRWALPRTASTFDVTWPWCMTHSQSASASLHRLSIRFASQRMLYAAANLGSRERAASQSSREFAKLPSRRLTSASTVSAKTLSGSISRASMQLRRAILYSPRWRCASARTMCVRMSGLKWPASGPPSNPGESNSKAWPAIPEANLVQASRALVKTLPGSMSDVSLRCISQADLPVAGDAPSHPVTGTTSMRGAFRS